MNNNERGKKGIILSEIKSWIVDAFFLIALIICILGLVYSVIVFSGSIQSNSNSFATMKQTLSQASAIVPNRHLWRMFLYLI